jgi:hypothetical protein
MSAQEEMNLIPRTELFKEKDIVSVQIAKDGKNIFYQKPGADGLIYYRTTQQPHFERELIYDGFVQSWATTHNGGVIAVVREDTISKVFYTNMRNRKHVDISPFAFSQLSFVSQSLKFPNKVAINLTAKEDIKSGYYLLDLSNGRTKKLGRFSAYNQIWFDDMFQAVAAMSSNDLGGNTLYRKAEGQWFEIYGYPFDVGMFLGGFQKVLSVSNDGKTIYATDNWQKDKTTLISIDKETGEITELASDDRADIIPFVPTIDVITGKVAAVVSVCGFEKACRK